MLALGFSAGLPLALVFGTFSIWLRQAGIERSTIGFLSWVGLAYTFKWAWSPLMDRMSIPLLTPTLGRRRSWLLVAQAAVMAGLVGMAFNDPRLALAPMVWCAVAVAFGSATQDIALDAFRIESAEADRQAALAATYLGGYRLAMIWSGAIALELVGGLGSPDAAHYQQGVWQTTYLVMAASMLPGMLTVLLSKEPAAGAITPVRGLTEWLNGALVEPFTDFIRRFGKQALLILALIATYRISDVVLGIMAYPFYVDLGFSTEEIGRISKVYGIIMNLLGAFAGGVLAVRLGVMRVLMLGAVLSSASNLLYVWLISRGHDVGALMMVISADNLAGGIATSAFLAYMASLTSVNYTATQYALFSSMMLLLPKFVAGFSGVYVDRFGYASFFVGTALIGLPVLVLIWLATRMKSGSSA